MAQVNVTAQGRMEFMGKVYKAALGGGGVKMDKKEGDGATPAGCFPMRCVYYRRDRVKKPETALPVYELEKTDGWCDEPTDEQNYNKKITLPYKGSHEELWREDHVYDIIVPLGYNDDPAEKDKGSAIFIHVARENYTPTAGCIAVSQKDLLELLENIEKETLVCIT